MQTINCTLDNREKQSIESHFEHYLQQHIKPSLQEEQDATAKLLILRTLLCGKDDRVKEVVVSGSFGRGTSVRPLHDVDLIAIINQKYLSHEDFSFLTAYPMLVNLLSQGCVEVKELDPYLLLIRYDDEQFLVRKQKCSIGICFGNSWNSTHVTFDIVPALENDDGTLTILQSYGKTTTNPGASKQLVAELEKQWEGKFSSLVQLMKKWNAKNAIDVNGEKEKPLKSYHLELVCCQFATQNNDNRKCAVQHCVRNALGYLLMVIRSGVPVPGLFNTQLLRGMDLIWPMKKIVDLIRKTEETATAAMKLELEGRNHEALNLWQSIFGNELLQEDQELVMERDIPVRLLKQQNTNVFARLMLIGAVLH